MTLFSFPYSALLPRHHLSWWSCFLFHCGNSSSQRRPHSPASVALYFAFPFGVNCPRPRMTSDLPSVPWMLSPPVLQDIVHSSASSLQAITLLFTTGYSPLELSFLTFRRESSFDSLVPTAAALIDFMRLLFRILFLEFSLEPTPVRTLP